MRDGTASSPRRTDGRSRSRADRAHHRRGRGRARARASAASTAQPRARSCCASRASTAARRRRGRELQRCARASCSGIAGPGRRGPHRAGAADLRRRPRADGHGLRARPGGARSARPRDALRGRHRAAARGPPTPGRHRSTSRVRKNITLPGAARASARRAAARCPSQRPRARARARRWSSASTSRSPTSSTRCRYLSGGNQQKVVLAKWLDSRRRRLHLRRAHPRHRRRGQGGGLPASWRSWPTAGKGVIFISSEFTELVGACNRVLVMREGRLVGELEGDDVTDAARRRSMQHPDDTSSRRRHLMAADARAAIPVESVSAESW